MQLILSRLIVPASQFEQRVILRMIAELMIF